MISTTDKGSNEKRSKHSGSIIQSEKLQSIQWYDYKQFFKFSYGYCGMISLFFICLLTSVAQLLPSLWLS